MFEFSSLFLESAMVPACRSIRERQGRHTSSSMASLAVGDERRPDKSSPLRLPPILPRRDTRIGDRQIRGTPKLGGVRLGGIRAMGAERFCLIGPVGVRPSPHLRRAHVGCIRDVLPDERARIREQRPNVGGQILASELPIEPGYPHRLLP